MEGLRVAPPAPVASGAPLWARGFRPFFLLAGAHGCVFVLCWLAILNGWLSAPAWLVPTWWHAHEMVFGFVAAAIAGFLLTSVPVWTGSPPVCGWRLAGLAGLWLAGRIAMTLAGLLPPLLVALVDVAFLPVLALALARPLLSRNQTRNRGFLLVLVALSAANLATHLQGMGASGDGVQRALRLGVDLAALLVVVVGGRITPVFTQNALRRAGSDATVVSRPWLDRLAVLAVVLVGVMDLVAPRSAASGAAALFAAGALIGRMAGWQSLRSRSDPLLWSLHLGYAWVALGLGCVALGDLTRWIPWTSGLHALTAGALGAMILAVMTRVGLGHTGRPLVAPRGIPAAYALVSIAALLRSAGPIALPELGLPVIVASGLLWSAAFGIFTWIYSPFLTRARVDGQPG